MSLRRIVAAASEQVTRLAATTFLAHGREVQRFLSRRVDNSQEIEDLSQEVFARLLRVENAEMVHHPLAYVLGIAAHVVQEFRERKQHQRVVFDSRVVDVLSESPEFGVENDADKLELQNWLQTAIQTLPVAHRAVLLLVNRDGLSYEEAAARTGLSVHTVEKYLVEARTRVRELLKDSGV